MGRERSRVLAVRSSDPVMSVLGPVGLAAAAETALLVDLGDEIGRGGGRTLADLAAEGPRLDELSPGRRGVAILRAGHLPVADCATLVDRLAVGWPAVVVRVVEGAWPGPSVPVRPLFPGWLAPTTPEASVWQSFPWSARPPGPGPVLPWLRPAEARRILNGGMPVSGKWLKAWNQVWEMPWA